MTELYVFRGTAGKAEMITDDKSGLRTICENLAAVDAAYKARLRCDNYGS
jgi:hypothetical protein